MSAYRLCVIEGDGIGREVVPVAVRVLRQLLPALQVEHADAGWECFQRTGTALPERTLQQLSECGAGLFGAVSSPGRKVAGYHSPIIALRQQLKLSVNVRPVKSWPHLSPRQDVDLLILRENSEGLYSGRERWVDERQAIAERVITAQASLQLAKRAAILAQQRQARRITLVHKANILPLTCGLFRDTCREYLQAQGWSAQLDERLVDVAALQLVQSPEHFDLLLTTNLFGDILSDLACYWSGGLGMAPSLNWGQGVALAEPVHGSAPDIAGTGRANPLAAILSVALLLRFHWQQPALADQLEHAVHTYLFAAGADLAQRTTAQIEQGVLAALG